jgi:uncharacterized protein (TIGR02271 family)
MSYTVVGIFDSKSEARAAMSELVQTGFIEDNIDISEGNYSDTNTASTGTNEGIGDSVSNFFSNLFSDDETQARNYSTVARDAEAVLSVQADTEERARQAAEIFDRNGAVDVDERSAQYSGQNFSSQTSGYNTQTSGTDYDNTTNYSQNNVSEGYAENRTNAADMTTDKAVIPVIEEELQVGKREVERGGVRVRSRVIEKPVEEHLRLRQERVIVNRHPVNREVTNEDLTNFREGDIEITERGEEAVVSKQARVVEEVEIGKQVEERDQVVNDTVRRTDVDVQEIDTDRNVNRAGGR